MIFDIWLRRDLSILGRILLTKVEGLSRLIFPGLSLFVQDSTCKDFSTCGPQPYHPAVPLKLSRVEPGQYLDGRPPGKTRLLLEEVLVRPAGGAHPVVCVGPNVPV